MFNKITEKKSIYLFRHVNQFLFKTIFFHLAVTFHNNNGSQLVIADSNGKNTTYCLQNIIIN